MGFTTYLELHSQAIRLCEIASWGDGDRADGVLTLSDAPFQETLAQPVAEGTSIDYNSPREIFKLAFARFARRY